MSESPHDEPQYDGLAATFDTAAELYERVRPAYPPQMFDDLDAMLGARSSDARVLEIGAGTGQATRGLLARGWHVVAVEPGRHLAAVAERMLGGLGRVEIIVAPFEDWRADRRSFDLVLAATSWHWLDQTVAFAKAAAALRPGGRLAIVATEHVKPEIEGDPFFVDVETAYEAVGMSDGLGGPPPPEAVRNPDVASIDASALFGPVRVRRYLWSRTYTAEEYIALLSSYSGHIAASTQQREHLFAEIGRRIDARPEGTVRKHYLTILQSAPVLDQSLVATEGDASMDG